LTDPRTTRSQMVVREALYTALAPSKRVALHRRIAVALENRADQGGSVTAAEVAQHYACSAPAGSADGVLKWALAAAEADQRRPAFAEAAGHLTRARLALTQAGIVPPEPERVDLLVAEAQALARAGEPDRARELLVRARGHAEACGDPARIGTVAFGLQHLGARFAMRRYSDTRDTCLLAMSVRRPARPRPRAARPPRRPVGIPGAACRRCCSAGRSWRRCRPHGWPPRPGRRRTRSRRGRCPP
jgi:hypothetical protein